MMVAVLRCAQAATSYAEGRPSLVQHGRHERVGVSEAGAEVDAGGHVSAGAAGPAFTPAAGQPAGALQLSPDVCVVAVDDLPSLEAFQRALQALKALNATGAGSSQPIGIDCEWRHPRPISVVQARLWQCVAA